MPLALLTLSALQTKTDNFANHVDPDEMVRNEPSHLDLHVQCLSFYDLWHIPLFVTVNVFKIKDGRVHFIISGVKDLKISIINALCSRRQIGNSSTSVLYG